MNTNDEDEMPTCRVHMKTTDDRARMVKYAARHWAHYRCWLYHKLGETSLGYKVETFVNVLASLHAHELREFPVLALADALFAYGHTTSPVVVIKAAIMAAEKREARPAARTN